MTGFLQQAVADKLVVGITFIHDYIQLQFEDGAVLNLYNKVDADPVAVLAAKGKRLRHISLEADKLALEFSDGIVIGMSGPYAAAGPEAAYYHSADRQIMIVVGQHDFADCGMR